jgi:glutathione synthase/RimK-type ligase-like ATP-grasp enzyme
MTPEGQLLIAELKSLGVNAQPLIWDDPSVDWSLPKVCVIRETWDYHHRRDEFVAWAERVGSQTTLLNSAEVVRWNSHKGYLRELEARRVPIVPTVWLDAGTDANLAHIMSSNSWGEVVIKPAVSASAFETIQIGSEQVNEGQAHIDRLLSSRDLMVQPFIPSVRDYGERSLIFIDGQLSHVVRRTPALHPEEGKNPWEATIVEPTREEAEMAAQMLLAAGHPTLYARVDIVRDEANSIRLMELELVEPSLFLTLAPYAAKRLAEVIQRAISNKQ